MTHLCVPIFITNPSEASAQIVAAEAAGADMVELRLDLLDVKSMEQLREGFGPRKAALIVTWRPTCEGGRSELDDEDRLTLLNIAADDANYVDIELQSLTRDKQLLNQFVDDFPPDVRARIILSYHDFKTRPTGLYKLIEEMNAFPADVNKIVWTARNIRDNLEAFDLLLHRTRPTIALCMGEAGLISRVLAKKFGGFLTFASLDDASATAPGQLTIADMKTLYRWDKIGPATRIYGVVADPVRHSMSPAIHNAAFDAAGYDGVYLPMLVEADYDSFESFMHGFLAFEGLDLSGLSVTIPHKEHALRYLREHGGEIEELAQRIGAVNTIAIHRDGNRVKLKGSSTDYPAILDCVTSALAISRDGLKNVRVGILGAGGTGRTALAALAHFEAEVLVCNRTAQRAEALAAEFGQCVRAVSLEDLLKADCRVIINTTSVGMYPRVDENPLGERPPKLRPETVVFDTVYNPMKTRLLAHAEACGCKTIGGVEMFVRQAVGQFETWTGIKAPTDVMRKVVEARLK